MIAYEHSGRYISILPYYGRITNRLSRPFKGTEVIYDSLVCIKWFINYKEGFSFRETGFLIDDDKACCRINALIIILWMIDEYDITRLRFMYFINSSCLAIDITNKARSNQFSYPFYRNRR